MVVQIIVPRVPASASGVFDIGESNARYATAWLTGLDSSGAQVTLRSVTYTVPSVQGAASTNLQNDGTGVLSWTAAFGVPALTLSTTNAAGVATSGIRTDATIAIFDITVPTTSAVGDAAAVGTAAFAARRDHTHGREAFVSPAILLGSAAAAGVATTHIRSDATIAAFDLTAPTTSAVGDAAGVGTVAFAARRDHVHGREAFVSPAIVLGSAAAAGVATTHIRSDATIAAFDLTAPTTSAVGDAAAVGTIAFAARRDHVHGREGFVSPSIVLGSAAAAGVATTHIRSDATIAAFDATAPVAQAFGDAAAVGSIAFAARRDHRHGMPATPVTSAVAGTGVTVSAATGAVTFSVDQAFSPTWTGTHVWNPGTTPATPVQVLIAQPTAAGTRNSHNSLMRGTSFDTAGHSADWQWFVSVTSNAGASTLTLQTRIDAAAFATQFSITDAGVLTVGSGNFAAPGASAVGDAIAAGTATTFSRSDHRHGRESFVSPSILLGSASAAGVATTLIRSDATIAAFDATAPTTSAVGDAAAVGTIAFAARRDHVHGREAFVSPGIVLGSAAAAGVATTLIRSDATIAAFDATAPVAQAFGDAAAVGTIAFAARRDHRHGMPATPVTSAVAGTGITVSAATGAVTFSVDQAFSPTWTGTHVWNPGTTPATPVQVLIAQPTAAGTRNSHNSLIRGTSYDTAGHNADWQWFASVTSNAGASTLTLQSRIDAAAFATRLSITDAGSLTVPGSGLGVRGVSYTWPSAQGGASQVLQNDGSGVLSWATIAGATYGVPALTLSTTNAAGVATTGIRTDATVAVFDTTAPTTSAVGDAAAVGTAAFTARRDHTHGREAFASPGAILLSDTTGAGTATTVPRSDHRHAGPGYAPMLMAMGG